MRLKLKPMSDNLQLTLSYQVLLFFAAFSPTPEAARYRFALI